MKIIEQKYSINNQSVLLIETRQKNDGLNIRITINSAQTMIDSYARIEVFDAIKAKYNGVSYLSPSLMKTPTKLYFLCKNEENSKDIQFKVAQYFQEDITQLIAEASMILKVNLD